MLTDEQVVNALEECKGNKTAAAKKLKITRSRIRSRLDRIKKQKQSTKPDSKTDTFIERFGDIVYHNKKKPAELNLDEMLDSFIETQGFRKNFSIKQFECKSEIKTKKPIAVTMFSDLHIGSPYSDYAAIREDVELVKRSPGVYVMLGGDLSDKMQTFRSVDTASGQLHPTQIQIIAEEKLMTELADRIVAKVGGNHDTMDARKSGVDSNYFILKNKKFPYMPYGGLMKLVVGEVEYKILWKHRYRFNSSLNQFNSHHRVLEVLEPTADMVVMEHEHNPGIESIEKYEFDSRRTVVNVRTGTYKVDDSYSMEFFKSGRVAPQTVILFPKERKILALHGRDAIKDAVTYLNGYEKR